MTIALCALQSTNHVETNLETIAEALQQTPADLLLFGEGFLQGFHRLEFSYAKDIYQALPYRSKEIAQLQTLCKEQKKSLGFGYYENHQGGIYASYMIIDEKGKILANYRRMSKGWKESHANADYREGKLFTLFPFGNKHYGIALCGDLWEDELITGFVEMDDRADAILWPVHCDYDVELWEKSEKEAYAKRSAIFEKPLLFVNSYCQGEGLAKGGAYVFHQGKIKQELPMGKPGILLVDSF